MGRNTKSKAKRKTAAWYRRHVRDVHVRRAKAEGRRSRAAFKLTEILDRHRLLRRADAVIVDLGCAPGSWCAELARRMGEGALVVGVDVLEMHPVPGVHFVRGDFTIAAVRARIEALLAGRPVDLVLSDMAPEMSGHRLVDQARTMELNEATLDFAVNHLRPGGHLLLKTFMGEGFDVLRQELNGWFAAIETIKPAASRKTSRELYLLGLGFRRTSMPDAA